MFSEVKDSIFSYIKTNKVDAICCTTNKIVKNNGELVMGAGIAKEFAKQYPTMAKDCGLILLQYEKKGYTPNVFIVHEPVLKPTRHYDPSVVYFATKNHWKDPSTVEIIEESLKQLARLANMNAWDTVVLPRPGCLNGGLDWTKDVKPLCEKYLNKKFIIISK